MKAQPRGLWEAHPEVSFAMLLARPASSPKKTWADVHERLQALRGAGIGVNHIGEAGRHAGVDDVLDAAAAAWSADGLSPATARVSLGLRMSATP